jgi:putative oxidoreductase
MKNVALWAIQVLLALLFLLVGVMKLATPYEALAASADWVRFLPPWLVLFIGVAEVAGALGIVLPAATGIRRELTPLAAGGLALIMVLATLFLVSVGQAALAPPNLVILALALIVVYGRRADLGWTAGSARPAA